MWSQMRIPPFAFPRRKHAFTSLAVPKLEAYNNQYFVRACYNRQFLFNRNSIGVAMAARYLSALILRCSPLVFQGQSPRSNLPCPALSFATVNDPPIRRFTSRDRDVS